MGDPISRVVRENQAVREASTSAPETKNNQDISKTPNLRLVVNHDSEYQSTAPAVETWVPKMNRLAREGVFRHIVSTTLNNPDHPYFTLVSPQLRQEMIEAITSELTDSHYLS